ncbi:MAG: hypothetical protein WBM32_21440 [Crocosphaera sp.]
MQIELTDFNDSDSLIKDQFRNEWTVIETILTSIPLHLKASSQSGIEGNPIFDPIGTNEFIKTELVKEGWHPNIPNEKQRSRNIIQQQQCKCIISKGFKPNSKPSIRIL